MSEKPEYHHYEEVKEKISKYVCTFKKLPIQDVAEAEGALALVTRFGDSSMCYKIYTSEFCAGKSFVMHEIGHVLCQHLRFEDTLKKQVLERLRGTWPTLKKYITFNPNERLTAQDSLVHLLCNYAMDMEVNSKFFDEDEKERMIANLCTSEIKRMKYIISQRLPGAAEATRVLERLAYNGKLESFATPVFPEDYGFPRGLSWLQYIDLIILSPDKVMKQVCESLRLRQSQLVAPGDPLPAAAIKKTSDSSDLSDTLTVAIQGYEASENPGKSKGDGHSDSYREIFKVHKLGNEVKRFINERSVVQVKETRSDYLYYHNRGKADGVFRGKSVEHNAEAIGNIYIIVDTSGSVPTEQLARLLSLFSDLRGMVGPDSKVIFWDTQLQRVSSLKEAINSIPCGYGTEIATAIEYAGKRYCKPDDRLFIISDYYDILEDWYEEILKLKCPCYGIRWGLEDTLSCVEQEEFADFCRKVETLFVQL